MIAQSQDQRATHWPALLPHNLTVPETSLWFNVEVSAQRYPEKPCLVYYDTPINYSVFRDEAERIAGYLQHECSVRPGDRVLLYLQNSPQWVIGYYAILRANAVVVPVNPMNMTEELAHYVANSGARVAIAAQDLLPQLLPLHRAHDADAALDHVLVGTYSDYLRPDSELQLPEFLRRPRQTLDRVGLHAWVDALAAGHVPGPHTAKPDDLCVMPYTSGTTGHPKGCMHSHRNVQRTAIASMQWFGSTQDGTMLAVLPLFHVTGMTGSMNGPIFVGATMVLMSRWDRDIAATLIGRHRISNWQAISTMVIDFIGHPRLADFDLSSLRSIRGGGSAMPIAVADKLRALTGIDYVEGYGMSETMAATHVNPPQRPKLQCLGIPLFNVDARIIDPGSFEELPQGEVGEIVISSPQVMRGYWKDEVANNEAFIEMNGRRYLRTGDLARVDEDGYFFMVDRLKRVINASGFKVWPAEVETLMYHHVAIQEVCVVGAIDSRRGETVKALVVLKPDYRQCIKEGEIIEWAHKHMAAYKCPRIVEFVDSLPKSGSGKVLWRQLQDQTNRINERVD